MEAEYLDTKDLVTEIKASSRMLDDIIEYKYISRLVVRYSVGSNTFRAFRGKPSVVFRTWAEKELNKKSFWERMRSFESQEEFDRWHKRFCNRFSRDWNEARPDEKPITFGQTRKLINLLLKGCLQTENLTKREKKKLAKFLHIPIDNFVLNKIRFAIAKTDYSAVVGSIPKTASMSFVKNEQVYMAIQNFIREICKRARKSPIVFDFVAWDKSH